MSIQNHITSYISNYWNRRAKYYDLEKGHMFHSNMEKNQWKKLLKRIIGDDEKLILDVGCGTGFLSIILSELGHKLIGIDFSKNMIEIANKNINYWNLKIPLIIGNAENTPFSYGSFDLVISRNIFWTLKNPKNAINHWKSILNDNGSIIITDGNWNFLNNDIYNKNIIKCLPLYYSNNRINSYLNYLYDEGFSSDLIDIYDAEDLFIDHKYLEIEDYFIIKAKKKK